MSGTLLTEQQKKNINNEVTRLRNFLQLFQFCRDRECKGNNFLPMIPPSMMKVIFS